MTDVCSMPHCGKLPRPGQRYCRGCHSQYMKAWRAKRRREQQELKSKVIQLRRRVAEQERELEELRAETTAQ